MGPSAPHSTVLTPAEEAMIVEFRRQTLLPLDDVLGCLRDSIPKLTRSSLHRCLERHGISRLPEGQDHASKRGKFDPQASKSAPGRCYTRPPLAAANIWAKRVLRIAADIPSASKGSQPNHWTGFTPPAAAQRRR